MTLQEKINQLQLRINIAREEHKAMLDAARKAGDHFDVLRRKASLFYQGEIREPSSQLEVLQAALVVLEGKS
jgi:hypothetical protein